MINGTLSKHLADIENVVNERINLIVKQLAESENVNEDLKSNKSLAEDFQVYLSNLIFLII